MKKAILVILSVILAFNTMFVFPLSSAAAPAELAWGPVTAGNLKFYMTNVHIGWAGPKFPSKTTPHANFHIDKKKPNGRGYNEVANYHIVKYQKNKKVCVYIYDSVKKKTVMDSCGDSWTSVGKKAASATKSFAKTALDNADYLASAIIWTTIVLLVIDIIVPGDPIPILPFALDEDEELPPYNEADYVTVQQTLTDTSGFDPSDFNPDTVPDIEGDISNAIPFDLPSWISSDEPVFWDGIELKPGQIGRVNIIKPINLWTRDANNKLVFVRILNPGEVYRVYGYDGVYYLQYDVGANYWVTNMEGYILYQTPSKEKLQEAND